MNGENLIFLISLPRSGSTLIQRILSNHSEIATTSEPWIALPLFYGNLFDNIKIKRTVPYNGKTSEIAIKNSLTELPGSTATLKNHFAKFYTSICQEISDSKGKKIFLDKTPRYYYIIDDLIRYFPKSKIIILYRNPFAVLNSILTTWVKKDYFLLSLYRNDILLAPKILSDYRNKPIKNVYQLEYEEFVKNTPVELKKLCHFLEIDFETKMMSLNGTAPKWKFGDPVNALNKSFIDNKSIDNWRIIRNTQQWRFYKDYLNELKSIDAFSYNLLKQDIYQILERYNHSKIKKLFTFSLKRCTSQTTRKYFAPAVKVLRSIKYKISKPI